MTGLAAPGLAVAGLAAPTPIGGDDARRLAEQELARPEYHQGDGSFVQRVIDAIDRFLNTLTGGGGGTNLVLGIVGVVIVGLVVVAAARAGRLPGRRRRDADAASDPLATTPGLDHAAEADRLRSTGAHAAAVREYLRAAIADLERRGVLAARPGRTGAAAAAEGGAALPAARDPLRSGARVFDETWFGARPATAADVETARLAFEAVRTAAGAGARS